MDPKKVQPHTYPLNWTIPYTEWTRKHEVLTNTFAEDNPEAARAVLSKFTLNGLRSSAQTKII